MQENAEGGPEPEKQYSLPQGHKKINQSQNVDPQVGFMSKICANSCLTTDSYLNISLWHHKHLTVEAEVIFSLGPFSGHGWCGLHPRSWWLSGGCHRCSGEHDNIRPSHHSLLL